MPQATAGAAGSPPPPSDPRRNPAALAAAVTEVVEANERPVVRVAIALVAGVAIILALLAEAVPWLAFLGRLPPWAPPAFITASAALLVAVMPIAALPRPVLDAWVTLTYFALNGRERWLSNGSPFPEAAALDEWLRRHDGPEHALARAEVLAGHGRIDEVVLPPEDPSDPGAGYLRAQLAWAAAFARGDDPAAEAEQRKLEAIMAENPAGADLDVHRAIARLQEATMAHAAGGDWIRPLAGGRRALGPRADGILLRHFILPRLWFYGRISLGIFAVAWLVGIVASWA